MIYQVLVGFTRFYRVLLGFTGLYWVLLGFTGFYRVLLGFTGFYRVLPGFTGFYRVLPGFTRFYRVLLGFTGFYWVLLGFTGFYRVLLGFTGFYRVLLGFTGFYWVLQVFAMFWWDLLGLTRFYGPLSSFWWLLMAFNGVEYSLPYWSVLVRLALLRLLLATFSGHRDRLVGCGTEWDSAEIEISARAKLGNQRRRETKKRDILTVVVAVDLQIERRSFCTWKAIKSGVNCGRIRRRRIRKRNRRRRRRRKRNRRRRGSFERPPNGRRPYLVAVVDSVFVTVPLWPPLRHSCSSSSFYSFSIFFFDTRSVRLVFCFFFFVVVAASDIGRRRRRRKMEID